MIPLRLEAYFMLFNSSDQSMLLIYSSNASFVRILRNGLTLMDYETPNKIIIFEYLRTIPSFMHFLAQVLPFVF